MLDPHQTAIVDFVQSLSDVSWEEIQSSGMTDNPRLFSLQKLVEISYYNMGRIRMEWSNIWAILGEHLNQVCCHSNANVSFFALDALRQLAVRFLEKEELPGFAFQREFLRPFEFAMRNNPNSDAREMVSARFLEIRTLAMKRNMLNSYLVIGSAMLATNDPKPSSQHALWLANHVWCFQRSIKSVIR